MQGENIVRSLTATKSGKTIRVAAGQYVIEVDGDLNGINIQGSSVSLTRGSTEVVKIQVASTTLSPDRDEHDPDIHGTGEEHPHPYLVWEDEGRVRLSHWFAQAVRIDDEALESINQLLSETWAKYMELESRHTTYSRDAGHLIGVISEFSVARQRLENDFWVRLDELVSGEQRARLHAISTASGDANGDDIWAYRPTAFPYLIGWHEKRFPVRVEIWKRGRSFHWRVSERKYAASGENQNLPSQLQHFWTLGNSKLDGQSATDGRAAEGRTRDKIVRNQENAIINLGPIQSPVDVPARVNQGENMVDALRALDNEAFLLRALQKAEAAMPLGAESSDPADRPTIDYSGICVRAEDGTPIAGAVARFFILNVHGKRSSLSLLEMTTTDKDGHFRFESEIPDDAEVDLARSWIAITSTGRASRIFFWQEGSDPRQNRNAAIRLTQGTSHRFRVSPRCWRKSSPGTESDARRQRCRHR